MKKFLFSFIICLTCLIAFSKKRSNHTGCSEKEKISVDERDANNEKYFMFSPVFHLFSE